MGEGNGRGARIKLRGEQVASYFTPASFSPCVKEDPWAYTPTVVAFLPPYIPSCRGVVNPGDASYLSAEECVLAAAARCTKAVCLGPSLARDSKATKAHEAKRD